jgi:hypothetical protein
LIGANELLKEFEMLCCFARKDVLEAEKCLSFVITKVEDEEIVELFEAAVEEVRESCEGENIG